MTAKRLRILHISDVHFGKTEGSGTNWRMRRVLGEAWTQNLREIVADGAPDMVCFTGDLAQSGKAHEYKQVSAFCDELLGIVKLDRSRLLVVPGNHDVDRSLNAAEWESARKVIPHVPREELAEWMPGGEPPRGVDVAWRDALLARQADYRAWLVAYGLSHCLPGRDGQSHPHLGYRFTLDGWPQPVHFVGLDSAWLAGDDNDAEKLRITDAQVGRHFASADGNTLGGVAIALMHHPVSTVADGKDIRGLLNHYKVPLLLHGHLHEADLARWQPMDAQQTATGECAAGCLYEHDRYPNGFQVIDLAIADAGAAAISQVWARYWTPKGKGRWFSDNSALEDAVEGRWRPPAVAPVRLPQGGCFGREVELNAIRTHLIDQSPSADAPQCMVLAGMPGIGKSRLAHTFIREHWLPSRGGDTTQSVCRLTLEPTDASTASNAASAAAEALALGLRIADLLLINANAGNLWTTLPAVLSANERLLLIENVDHSGQRLAVAALIARLASCRVLVTARQHALGSGHGWAEQPVLPLAEPDSLKLLHDELRGITGKLPPDAELRELARQLGHVPLALHIAAAHVSQGVSPRQFLADLRANGFTAEPLPGDAALSEDAARAVLASTFRLAWQHWHSAGQPAGVVNGLLCLAHAPAEGVGASLGAALCGLDEQDYETLCVHARRNSLLEFAPDSKGHDRHRMHPLLAEWLRSHAASGTVADAALPADAASHSFDELTMARLADWMCERMPEGEHQGEQRAAIRAESDALLQLLSHCPATLAARVNSVGNDFATDHGPYAAWAAFCERGLTSSSDSEKSNFLWTLTQVAMRSGDLDRAASAARNMHALDLARGELRAAAMAQGALADVLSARGELDEALRIRRVEQLPVYEKLGDVRSRAVTLGKIAHVLTARGELDEALRIRREEELPVYEKLGNVRESLVCRANMAIILKQRRQRGDFDAARALLKRALTDAERLRIPEAGQIRALLAQLGAG
jgi:3',5'-cyclic AMP phosphodiesterase CpdA/tetratricopeptide (TPR) repeat protein